METSTDNRIVFCTHPDLTQAKKLAAAIIDQQLAACVNVIPAVTSIYRWENKTEIDEECQLIIKTRLAKLQALEELLKQQHPYELPELIAVTISEGSAAYLDWIRKNT